MTSRRPPPAAPVILAALLCVAGCDRGRDLRIKEPIFEGRAGVGELLASKCGECHSGDDPEAGWRVDSYIEVIGCVEPSGEPAVLPADDAAPILRCLDDADHAGAVALTDAEKLTLSAWVRGGASARHGATHDPRFSNPRSPEFHGRVLRAERWARMLSTEAPDACGRCHAGAPTTRASLQRPSPVAPACTTCHPGPEGALGCGTCHGDGSRASPPTDPCFATDDSPPAGAHAVHVEGGELRAAPLDCTACHPERDEDVGTGAHGDGVVDVALDPAIAGPDARYDAEHQTCTVACHDHGGERARPSWFDDEEMACDSCHLAPPDDHNPAACDSCHIEANADGTELTPGPLHLNGTADVGNGHSECGACHGHGDDPWPDTGPHPAHMAPEHGPALECETCHVVPEEVLDEGHLDDTTEGADVDLDPAIAGPDARYEASTRTCTVACHDHGGLRARPTWDDEPEPMACDSCHLAPPDDHNPATCDTCHVEANADGTELTPGPFHMNGSVDLGDGSGDCGTCHGHDDDPWPTTGAHPRHRDPDLSAPVECSSCHVVPEEIDDEGHLDDTTEGADVVFGGIAIARGATPLYDAQTCSGVACHGAGMPGAPQPPVVRWDDESGEASRCGACHAVPPPPPHSTLTTCEALICHGGEITRWPDGPRITETGRALHIDGVIEVAGRAR
jgi:predicted CxxxxCH...CXXCH cytochrome family protein